MTMRRTDLPEAVRCPVCDQPTVSVVTEEARWQLFCRSCQATLTLVAPRLPTQLAPPGSAPPFPRAVPPLSGQDPTPSSEQGG